jgi:ribosomal protein S18 acetylase RimI-like enzyme
MPGESVFTVRPATTADAEAIAAVNLAAGRVAWASFLDPEALAGIELPVDRWHDRLAAAGPDSAWLAIEQDEAVGFALVRHEQCRPGEPGELTAIYTLPRVWGRGVGRTLLARALDAMRASGCGEAVLWTEERNERPRRIYELAGWRLDGGRREREFLGHPIRELRYRIALTDPAASPGEAGRARA